MTIRTDAIVHGDTKGAPLPGGMLALVFGSVFALTVAGAPVALRFAAFALVSAMTVAAALALRPAHARATLLGLLAASFVFTGIRQDVGFIVMEPWQFVMLLGAAVWAGDILKGRRVKIDRVGVCALLVVCGALLSFIGAIDAMTWLKRAMRIAMLFGMYVYLTNHLSTRDDLAAFLRTCLVACVFSFPMLLFQMLENVRTGFDFSVLADPLGTTGTFANANEAATYLAMFLTLAAALYYYGAHTEVFGRRLFIVVAVLTALSVILIRSRAGMLAIAPALAVFFVKSRYFKLFAAAAVVVLIAAWNAPFVNFFVARIAGTFGASGDAAYDTWVQVSAFERFYFTQLYWEVIKAYPFFGIGAGNYAFIGSLPLDFPLPFDGVAYTGVEEYLGHSSHNGFVNWWAEAGTVGLATFVGALAYASWRLARLFFRPRFDAVMTKALSAGVAGMIFIFIMANLSGEFGVSEARFWLLLAFASAVLGRAARAEAA